MLKTPVTILRGGIEGRNARDQVAFCSFHSFLVKGQMKAAYIHATHAYIATWRLGLQAHSLRPQLFFWNVNDQQRLVALTRISFHLSFNKLNYFV